MFSSTCHPHNPTTHCPEQQDPGEDHVPPDTVCDVESWPSVTAATDIYTPAGIIEASCLHGSPQKLSCAALQNAPETAVPHALPGIVQDTQCNQNILELSPSNRDVQTVPESPQPPSSAGVVGERGGLGRSSVWEGGSEEGEGSGRGGKHDSSGQELKSISQSPKSIMMEEEVEGKVEEEEQKEEEEEEEEDKKEQKEGQREEEERKNQRKEDKEQEKEDEEDKEQERVDEEDKEQEREEDKEQEREEDEDEKDKEQEREDEEDKEQEREDEEDKEQEREEDEDEKDKEQEREDKDQEREDEEDKEQEREEDEEQEREEDEDEKDKEQERGDEEEQKNIAEHEGEKKEYERSQADDMGVGEKVIVAWTQSIVAMAALQAPLLVQGQGSVAADSHILPLPSLSQCEGREKLLEESDEEIEMLEHAEILTTIPPPPPPPPPPPALLRLFTKARTISTPPPPPPLPPMPGMLYLMKADGEHTDCGSRRVKTDKTAPLLPFLSLHEHPISTYTPPSSDPGLMPVSEHGEPPSKRVKLSRCSLTAVPDPTATSIERGDTSTCTVAYPEIAVCVGVCRGGEAGVGGLGEPVESADDGSCTTEQAITAHSAQENAYPPYQGVWNEGGGRKDEDGDSSAMEHELLSPLTHSTKDTQTEAVEGPPQDHLPQTGLCAGPLEPPQTGLCAGPLEEQVVPAGRGRLEDALMDTQSMYSLPLDWQKQEEEEVESLELPSLDEAVPEEAVFPSSPPARWAGGTSAHAPGYFHCCRATGWGYLQHRTALGVFID